jgi:hypothetical protein
MNDKIKELVEQNERIKNLYDIGPVQRAEVEQFAEALIEKCIALMEDSGTLCMYTTFDKAQLGCAHNEAKKAIRQYFDIKDVK